ncbi:MAG: pyrogallol hydroxytransferase large subunit, partial [Pseudomonadota bacterium]|nr:pyrogallol hydroxytransferase large subunit [Pseudomonadota bacterium]
MGLSFILYFLKWYLRFAAWRSSDFARRLKEQNLTAQFKIADDSDGRFFVFKDGKLASGAGLTDTPDVSVIFKNQKTARELLIPPLDFQKQIDAIKNFNLTM